MPRFIGCAAPEGANQVLAQTGLIKLTYSQMRLMDPIDVYYVVDTSDRGGKGRMAKRWYRWYTARAAIELNPRSTANMRNRAK